MKKSQFNCFKFYIFSLFFSKKCLNSSIVKMMILLKNSKKSKSAPTCSNRLKISIHVLTSTFILLERRHFFDPKTMESNPYRVNWCQFWLILSILSFRYLFEISHFSIEINWALPPTFLVTENTWDQHHNWYRIVIIRWPGAPITWFFWNLVSPSWKKNLAHTNRPIT